MKRYYIGIDIGGTNTKIALLDKRFKILKRISLSTPMYKGPHSLFFAIIDSVSILFKTVCIDVTDIYGIGVGVAGLVDARAGIVYNLINIPGWKGFNIKIAFENKLGLPTYVDNDANVMALAELYKGAGRGKKNIVCVTLGTGVGGGIVIEGKIYRGSTSSAGEIGHIPINEKGPKCNCGGVACIERYVGNRYLIREVIQAIRSGRKTILAKMSEGKPSKITLKMVYKAALDGDRFAIDFWKRVGMRIGTALSGIVNVLNPDRIIIGGGIAGAGRFLHSPLRKTINKRAMEVQRRHVKVVRAQLGKDAGLIGAGILVKIEMDKRKQYRKRR